MRLFAIRANFELEFAKALDSGRPASHPECGSSPRSFPPKTRSMDAAVIPETESMREAMAQCASGVCVVTVGAGLERHGLTVTSMTSVSLEPPTLLFCLNQESSARPLLERTRCFAVNVLAAHHSRVADQFA